MKPIAIVLGILAGISSAPKAQNLIPFNAGFELGSPAGWYMWIDERSSGNASFQTVEKDAHTGGYALQFDVKRPTREIWQISLNIPQWAVKPATRYRVKFWAKGPGSLRVNFTDAEKDYAWMGGFGSDISPTQWTEVQGEIATTSQSGKGKVSVGVNMGLVPGSYLFDDFSIEEIGPSTK